MGFRALPLLVCLLLIVIEMFALFFRFSLRIVNPRIHMPSFWMIGFRIRFDHEIGRAGPTNIVFFLIGFDPRLLFSGLKFNRDHTFQVLIVFSYTI